MTSDTVSRYSQGATKELLEKLQWHLASLNTITQQLSSLGHKVQVGALTNPPLLVLNGGKSLMEQVSVVSPKRTRTP